MFNIQGVSEKNRITLCYVNFMFRVLFLFLQVIYSSQKIFYRLATIVKKFDTFMEERPV